MKKTLTISLIPAILLASAFMISESGEYYSTFYTNSIYKGYWSAGLVEIFLVIFSLLYFKKSPLLNFCIKYLMISLFIVMISGASLKIISPLLVELNTIKKNDRLVDFLLNENAQSKTNLVLLEGQKNNTALQTKHHRKIAEKAIQELEKEEKSGLMIWITIFFTAFLRFSVQLSNLVMSHILGKLWRENFKTKRKYTKKNEKFWSTSQKTKVAKLKVAK